MRRQNKGIFVVNSANFGQLVNTLKMPENRKHPEIFRILENHDLWEKRYIKQKVQP